ncbi:MAG TPA: ribonuclease R [Ignavibacteriaceae bacterium]|nr:ribonuclease R [Ignavibacteriaceae bacterium]
MKKKLIAFFKKNPGRQFKSNEIAKRISVDSENEYSSLKVMLNSLYNEGFLSKSGKRYKYTPANKSGQLIGQLEVNQGGFGFVVLDNKNDGDIFIAARNLGTAFDGDIVEISLFAKQKRKNVEGQIVKVIKRKREVIVGTLKKSKSFYFVKPDDQQLHRDFYIDKGKLNGANVGDKVIAGKIQWENPNLNPEAEIVEVLGAAGSQDAEIVSLAREFNLPYKFPLAVIDEADSISEEISQLDLNGRLDYRNKVVFTIDPADAKDFDDALSIEILENGNYSVGIHIADVSNYVLPGSNIDKQARLRGNSTYLVGRVIPMLPEKLSNNICSLVPSKDRLTYSVIAELSNRGKLIDYKISKTIINSKRRFTYDEAQEVIENNRGDFTEELLLLNKLAQILRKKRMREGSIEFHSPEVNFELDENGKPVNVYKKELKQSNNLVEEFMLLANQVVAKHIGFSKKAARPFIYRIHDLPASEKIIEFSKFVKSLGYSFDPNATAKSNQFQQLIEQAKGTEEESVINELAIRSMAKAVYSVKNIGHYGLGFKYYTHFTSPIRRYADLIVHKIIFQYISGNEVTKYGLKLLDEIAEHISACERNSVEAERLSVKLKQVEYLQDHLGEEFHAIISGVTNFGIFVKIADILAEGLIRLKDLEDDFYVYDEKKYALIGRRTKKQFRLGDRVQVKLVRVDPERSELDFIIIE